MDWLRLPSGKFINVAHLSYVSEFQQPDDESDDYWILCYFTTTTTETDLLLYGSDAGHLYDYVAAKANRY